MFKTKLFIGFLAFTLLGGLFLGCSSAKRQTGESSKKKEEEAKKKESKEKAKKKKDIRYGLNLEERKQIFDEVDKIQDAVPPEDPQYYEKMQEAYPTVAKQHDLSEDAVRQIAIEGAQKNWATPSPP